MPGEKYQPYAVSRDPKQNTQIFRQIEEQLEKKSSPTECDIGIQEESLQSTSVKPSNTLDFKTKIAEDSQDTQFYFSDDEQDSASSVDETCEEYDFTDRAYEESAPSQRRVLDFRQSTDRTKARLLTNLGFRHEEIQPQIGMIRETSLPLDIPKSPQRKF